MQISATIIARDEERNFARAIESLRCCDEILVVDSGSIDRTIEIANKLGARVVETGWRGYAGQKNYAAERACHDWILSIDADEALSESLEADIWLLKKNGPRFDAYCIQFDVAIGDLHLSWNHRVPSRAGQPERAPKR